MSKIFKNEKYKYKDGPHDIYKKSRNYSKVDEKLTKNEKLRCGIKLWASFWRENIHRFVEDYFGIKLYLFQKILLYLMNHINFFMWIAARGQSKSFLTAIFCCARCVLYPGTKIILASGLNWPSSRETC